MLSSMTDDFLNLHDHAQLSDDARDDLARQVASHFSLARVVTWALNRSPSRMVVDVVKQDEFTQDVVLPYDDDLFLVYDCT